MRTLEILSKKLKFVEIDTMVKTSKALNDVQPELEKLRQKAVSKVLQSEYSSIFIFDLFQFLVRPEDWIRHHILNSFRIRGLLEYTTHATHLTGV